MSGTQTSTSKATVTPGNWISQSINGMNYDVLLPANYDPSIKYPTMLYLHQLDMGNYPAGLLAEVDPWFNTAAFRAATSAIIVMPLLDQTADPSGQTINFGGVATADNVGETNAIAALKQIIAQYSTDPSRIYVTGNSLGGIGTEDMLIKFNAYTGTEAKIFAAGLALAGADYGQGYPQPNASVVTGLKNVPFWAIHGGQDTQVPLAWDQNLFAAEQAAGGVMKYTQDNSLGHDVWDTYYTQSGASSPLGWLFSQKVGAQQAAGSPQVGAATTTAPTATPSPNNTVVTGTASAITDASGNKWTISSGGKVVVNGIADATTSGVIELAYVNGTIWQENSSKLWWGETQPNASWAPIAGTSTSPLPAPPTAPPSSPSANNTVVKGATGTIIDASGNRWTITNGGQVAINGTADATTSGVFELAYVNGTIWQENSSSLWWGETQPNASWAPSAGTSVSPLSAPPPPASSNTFGSGTDTIVMTMSDDPDGPAGAAGRDAQFTLNVDGQQIGGLQTVTASRAAGQTQTFTFKGNFAPGAHKIAVTFANNSMTGGDKAAFNDGGDRNLYVNTIAYDGVTVKGSVTGIYESPFFPPLSTDGVHPGNAVFAITDATVVPANAPSTPSTTPAAVTAGTGADTLVLAMSEDPYQGDAQFSVAVDGKPFGTTLTTSAVEYMGQTQQFVLHGSWGNGPHTVSIAFLNDAIGPPDARGTYDSVDRNLFINAVSYDGTSVSSTPWGLFGNVSQSYTIPATKPLPPSELPPPVTPSPNNTMVLAGSSNAITDASGNKWTITAAGQVAVNGVADTTTGNVTELAYVNKAIWQENTSNLWWQKASPAAAWGPSAGSSVSPLPAPITLAPGTSTVSQSQVSLVATAGSHMLFLSGSGDVVNLSGGANTITDTGLGNTYVIPAAGHGSDSFTSNILATATLDLKPALAATDWNGAAATLSKYLIVADSTRGATLSIAATAGGTGVVVATIGGATAATLSTALAHSIT